MISALLYLHGGFGGSELVFDAQGLEIRPEAVRPVTRGLRYSMPIWFKLAPGRPLPGRLLPYRFSDV